MTGIGKATLAMGLSKLCFPPFYLQLKIHIAAIMFALPGLVFAQTQMAIPGSVSVSPTGAATYNIPIQVPPGTAGIQPSLALTYNSQSGNGLAGVGWSLSGFSAILRCPRTIVQDGISGSINYDANDRFCLNGERLIRIDLGLNYGAPGQVYRTEHESFTKVQSFGGIDGNPAYFVARTKSGQNLYFGNTPDSAVEAYGQSKIRSWALGRVEDRAGNFLTISYFENSFAGGEHKPAVISYTGNSNTGIAPYASVTFNYESTARPDAFSGYESGSIVQDTRRLGSITTKVGTSVVKNYFLTYQTALSPDTNRSRLESITECDAAETCLPSTFATYAYPTLGFGNTQWTAQGGAEAVIGDYNGDGRVDMANYTGSGGVWRICLSSGSGFSCNPWTAQGGAEVITGDFNGDGRTDLASYSGSNSIWRICLSTGVRI